MRNRTVYRFRRPTVLEVVPLADLPTSGQPREIARRKRSIRRVEEFERNVIDSRYDGYVSDYLCFASASEVPVGWYGSERDAPVPALDHFTDGDGTVLEFLGDTGCRVLTSDLVVDVESGLEELWPERVRSPLVALDDGPLTGSLLDPARSFFRHPGEAVFWDRIAANIFDAAPRLAYADWLDAHDDPHAWAFREPGPFLFGSRPLDWLGAMGRIECGPPDRRTLWGFARITNRVGAVPFTLSDGTPVPQFVAYLLGVTRIRADERLPELDRGLLVFPARALGLTVAGDILLGPDHEPICRVADTVRTVSLLCEAMHSDPVPPTAALIARLQGANDSASDATEEPTSALETTDPAEPVRNSEETEWSVPSSGLAPVLRLVGLNDLAGRVWYFSDSFEVGRQEGRFLAGAQNGAVSRRHAAVFRHPTGWWVTDQRSTNGTFLNDVRLGEDPVGTLRAGDVLRFSGAAVQVEFMTEGADGLPSSGPAEGAGVGGGWARSTRLADSFMVIAEFTNREYLLARCGCARRFAHLFRPEDLAPVERAERSADEAPPAHGPTAEFGSDHLTQLLDPLSPRNSGHEYDYLFRLLALVGDRDRAEERAAEVAAQEAVIWDVFGDLQRTGAIDGRWLTTDVIGLARHMYGSGDFSAMPILADALMDAGCADTAVLEHCRGDTSHVRGCWVVDAVLGHRTTEARLRQWGTDPLTGCASRRAFDRLLVREVKRAAGTSTPLSVLSFEFDHFGQINSAFGHSAGDRVLAAAAGRIRDALGHRGVLARTGGDDFAAVLPLTDSAEALGIGERTRSAVEAGRTVASEGSSAEVRVTVSVGVAALGTQAPAPRRLFDRAVEACRRAKLAGRNRVCE